MKSGTPGHEALLGRIAARDKGALIELYARSAPSLLSLVSRIAPDPQDAAAAVEDSFIHLWRNAPRFPRETASLAAWLVVTARRIAIERCKSKGVSRRQSEDPARTLMKSYLWLPRPEDVARIEARRELLRKVLQQLPAQQHASLDLAVWEGKSEEQIAEKLEEPLARVQASMRAGMRFIRHRMRVVLGTWSAHI